MAFCFSDGGFTTPQSESRPANSRRTGRLYVKGWLPRHKAQRWLPPWSFILSDGKSSIDLLGSCCRQDSTRPENTAAERAGIVTICGAPAQPPDGTQKEGKKKGNKSLAAPWATLLLAQLVDLHRARRLRTRHHRPPSARPYTPAHLVGAHKHAAERRAGKVRRAVLAAVARARGLVKLHAAPKAVGKSRPARPEPNKA